VIRHLTDWALPTSLALVAARIATTIVREFRRDRRRDEQLHREDVPSRYDVATAQAIQDAPDPLDLYAELACAHTQPTPPDIARAAAPILTADQWEELAHAFAADAYTYRAGGGMPGEHRTTWTREDYRS
jgi:hypothetical protein